MEIERSNLCLFMKAFHARGECNVLGSTWIFLKLIRKENITLGSVYSVMPYKFV